METYEDVLQEIATIDAMLAQGYQFNVVYENLSGTFAELKMHSGTTTLPILTAEARKYVAMKLKEQVTLI